MSTELTIALAQMTSIDDVDANLMQMESLIEQGLRRGHPDLICFPENCLYMRLKEGEKIQGLHLADPCFRQLAKIALEKKIFLHLGASPIRIDEHLYNSSVLITDEGEILPSYQKMHLFDIQLQGQPAFKESDVFRHGQKPNILELRGWKIGQSICYDIRFAELYSYYARKEVDMILVPASFLVKTGEAHWEVLMRARAIESQAFVVASAQAGTHKGIKGGLRETYGNSMVVDPWGKVVCRIDTAPGIQIYTLTRDLVDKVRQQIPMKYHRRLPIHS